ncbi:adenosylmethionine decarboxylase [Mesobacillus foraminis]|uniref:adenosylmethionine decarboxylase n=1 Tax=Mesobacillus foraminis TaxID=279826 RepID=UPI000EF4A985|nr:adenosylmethionine decarboxylase [Mesobacillus foraminis]
MTYETIGNHILADFWGVDFDKLNDMEFLKKEMAAAAEASGAKIVAIQGKAFEPIGATVLILLSESHLSIHTYPEKGYAAVDGFTCGEKVAPEKAISHLMGVLDPEKAFMKKVVRGTGELEITPLNLE